MNRIWMSHSATEMLRELKALYKEQVRTCLWMFNLPKRHLSVYWHVSKAFCYHMCMCRLHSFTETVSGQLAPHALPIGRSRRMAYCK